MVPWEEGNFTACNSSYEVRGGARQDSARKKEKEGMGRPMRELCERGGEKLFLGGPFLISINAE